MSKNELKMIKGLNKTNLKLYLSYALNDLDNKIFELFNQKIAYTYSENVKNQIYTNKALNIFDKKQPIISVFIGNYSNTVMHFIEDKKLPDEYEHVLIEWNDVKKLIVEDMKNGHGTKENLVYNLLIIMYNRFTELDQRFNLTQKEEKDTQIKRYERAKKDINLLNEDYYELLKSEMI